MFTLGQTKSSNINRILTIIGDFHFVVFSKWDVMKCDHIMQLIILTRDYIKRLLRTVLGECDVICIDQRCPTLSPIATCGDKHFKCGDRHNSLDFELKSYFYNLEYLV